MAYINNGKIDIPLGYDQDDVVEEIAGLLNVNPRADGLYRIADVCLADNINKWSRCKPIEHPSTSPLTSEQRKGSADQQADGIFYGIKINGNISPTINASLAQVHDVTFEYVRPTGWKRLLDFDGYNHNAQASPSYQMPDEGTWEDPSENYGGIGGIDIYYSTTGSGVNLVDRLVGVDVNSTLKRAFPAIVVTKVATGQSYMTALFEQGTTTAYPLMNSSGDVTDRNYHCQMGKPLYSSTSLVPLSSPFTSAEVVRVSIILVVSQSTTQPLLSAAGPNFGENWIALSGSILSDAKPIVLAGNNGGSITLKDIFKGVKFVPTSADVTILGIPVVYEEITGKTSTNEITITARAVITKITGANGNNISTSGAGGTATKTLNGWNGSGGVANRFIIRQTARPQSGEVWEGYVTITTKDGTNASQTSERYYFVSTII